MRGLPIHHGATRHPAAVAAAETIQPVHPAAAIIGQLAPPAAVEP